MSTPSHASASSRIATMFSRCKAEGRSAFIPFIMGGDPHPDACEALLNALPDMGADMIELGIPFSDPMADGPIIQAAGLRALAQRTTLRDILAMAKRFRQRHTTVPLVLMGYYNPIYRFGAQAFAEEASSAGIDGVIIVDVPPEEEAEIAPFLSQHGVAMVRLITPTSIAGRLQNLIASAQGYIYYIAVAGITGSKSADIDTLCAEVAQVKQATTLPVAVGFGIKTSEQAKAISAFADGVVVGSALVQEVGKMQNASTEELLAHMRTALQAIAPRI